MYNKYKKCVGIIFGGKSNEHSISIESARTIHESLNSNQNKKKYKTKVFYINKHGHWFPHEESIQILQQTNIESYNSKILPSKLNFLDQIDCEDIDIWFPVLHGKNGEDGTIQGLLNLTQKPYVSSGILGSSLGMDKIACKLLFSQLKIPQVNYFPIQNFDLSNEFYLQKTKDEIMKKLTFPLFVKPANSGSSLGISKVKNEKDLVPALKKAWVIDSRIVVEEGLQVRELECGVIGNANLYASEVGEVNYSSEWYDYDSKYKSPNRFVIPTKISPTLKKKIQEIAIKSCYALNINIFARVDFFLEEVTSKVYLNEINTIPGFTKKSMFPLLWNKSGLEIDQLVAKIIEYSF
tara:strand:+ start:19158 stop:20210 length:1053 start_codon:yes stop_codon:yes gene_type:complete